MTEPSFRTEILGCTASDLGECLQEECADGDSDEGDEGGESVLSDGAADGGLKEVAGWCAGFRRGRGRGEREGVHDAGVCYGGGC